METQAFPWRPKITSQHSSSRYCKERSETCQLSLFLESYNTNCLDYSSTGKNTWKILEWDWQAPVLATGSFLLHDASWRAAARNLFLKGDWSPPTKWPSAKVRGCWMNSRVFLKKTWFEEFFIWRAQVMGALTTWVELLQQVITPGLGGISASPQCCSPSRNAFSKLALNHLFGKRSRVGKTH